ncbi:Nif3-like dinuclear metal center hexameric protein [Candidatus Erwinia haradaeae]|uniref:GTP cyclohydrolase 1 type 2 homolog n=1 Tax=Candidatus Erwinia haradaeae TaxID=1922217 RepID=A0A451D557_9GAMM|nr:Nif3-like dinuclear metal center hexameric protein [Candidatus Erwinia haradaeae]VFP80725.1 GTP cyclohydrolase 1 type 2 homolog [Candidatus Erwinia haradaeae]
MSNFELEKGVNQLLHTETFSDNVINGLQVEGRKQIKKVITGVTACYDLLNEAVRLDVDAIVVHHGYFWNNEPSVIKGMKRQRLRTLLVHDINLFAWHMPLDVHPKFGNNTKLAELLDIEIKGNIINPLILWGTLKNPISADRFKKCISMALGREPLHCYANNAPLLIECIALCSGGGQKFIDKAADFGVDAFITGEISENTVHSAREQGLHFFAAGHHATERGGIQALGDWLARKYNLEVIFIDIDNPV